MIQFAKDHLQYWKEEGIDKDKIEKFKAKQEED